MLDQLRRNGVGLGGIVDHRQHPRLAHLDHLTQQIAGIGGGRQHQPQQPARRQQIAKAPVQPGGASLRAMQKLLQPLIA